MQNALSKISENMICAIAQKYEFYSMHKAHYSANKGIIDRVSPWHQVKKKCYNNEL
jgi:hypothetical protein